MKQGQSLTIQGLFVSVLAMLAQSAGYDLEIGALNTTVTTVITLLGVAGVYWGRVRKGDIDWLGFRK